MLVDLKYLLLDDLVHLTLFRKILYSIWISAVIDLHLRRWNRNKAEIRIEIAIAILVTRIFERELEL